MARYDLGVIALDKEADNFLSLMRKYYSKDPPRFVNSKTLWVTVGMEKNNIEKELEELREVCPLIIFNKHWKPLKVSLGI